MANFNQSPNGQTSVAPALASVTFTAASPATGYTTGPRPAMVRYFDSPDGQLFPQLIPIS